VRGLLALGEAYPNLKSSDQFVEMEKTLRDLEKQIADRREMYNESVTNFNTRCQIFPDVFFAQMLGYKTVALYKVEAFERETPPMKLDLPA
jgi:LemA protein